MLVIFTNPEGSTYLCYLITPKSLEEIINSYFYISLKNDKNSLKELKVGCLISIFSNRMDTKYLHDEELEILHDFHFYMSDLSPKV